MTDQRLGTEPIRRLFVTMTLPVVLQQLLMLLNNVVDRIWIAHIPDVGQLAFTASGVCVPIVYMIMALAELTGTGISSRVGLLLGQGHHLMFGFGINPGILEHVYQRYKPQEPHYAFELEHDDSVSDEYEVFGTWSPFMYAEESCRAELVFRTRQNVIDVTQQLNDEGGTIRLTYHGSERHYLPVPHEELLSMLHSDENLLGTANIYQAPRGMQQHFLERGADITDEELLAIPVPHCLKGEDQSGILFWDTKEHLYWVKSVVDNQSTWKRYGTNAVCWETATGAWIAYRLLDAASTDHPHTMTELSQLMPEKIDALLKQISLTFETEEQPFSIDEFKQNIMRFF